MSYILTFTLHAAPIFFFCVCVGNKVIFGACRIWDMPCSPPDKDAVTWRVKGCIPTVAPNANKRVRDSGYKYLSNTMLFCYHVIISGSRKHWKPPAFCLPPSLPLPSSITVSLSVCPCASAVVLPSFLSLPGVLCFFASSLHQPPFLSSPSFPSLSPSLSLLLLFSLDTLRPLPAPPTSIVLPLLDSILFLPLPLPPSLPLSFFVSTCIMPFLISLSHSASCWVFIIRYTISLSLSPCLSYFVSCVSSPLHDAIIWLSSLFLSFSRSHACRCLSVCLLYVWRPHRTLLVEGSLFCIVIFQRKCCF